MAKQKSVIKLKGTIDGITYYKGKSGYLARQATSLDGGIIATDPRFERTRENNAEFGRAGQAGKLIRKAFREQIQQAKDGSLVGRLSRELMKVVKADAVSERGKRNVLDGELELLKGFNFNSKAPLDTILYMNYIQSIDRVTGALKVDFPIYQPTVAIQAPQGSTHYELVVAGASIDFENQISETELAKSGELPLQSLPTVANSLSVSLDAGSAHPLFLLLGVIFYQEINGFYYHLSNGAFNGLAIVDVEGI